jgi:hypothetical protein
MRGMRGHYLRITKKAVWNVVSVHNLKADVFSRNSKHVALLSRK